MIPRSSAVRLEMRRVRNGSAAEGTVLIRELVIAGWTGRDREAVERHIAELAAIGVPRPHAIPSFYPLDADLLTTASQITVDGPHTSGEAEFVLFSLDDGLWVGVGSDHTDRRLEAASVWGSKRCCAKPVGRDLWRFSEVAPHWDRLILRSYAADGEGRRPYQEGRVAALRPPEDLVERWVGGTAGLPPGTALFCGTLPALVPLRGTRGFEVELEDPMLGRKISHAYEVRPFPVSD